MRTGIYRKEVVTGCYQYLTTAAGVTVVVIRSCNDTMTLREKEGMDGDRLEIEIT